MTRKCRVGRIALYLVLLSLVFVSVASTVYSKYTGTYYSSSFKVYVTAGDVGMTVTMNNGDNPILVPGTTVAGLKNCMIKVKGNSEDCYVFVKVDKTGDTNNRLTLSPYSDWKSLSSQDNVYYMEISKQVTDKECAFYNNKTALSVSPLATAEELAAITGITFTAYAVQKTPGITDAATAWQKLLESQSS